MDEEKLIECVRDHPCIWKTDSKSYKDLRARENSWKEISSQVSSIEPYKMDIHGYLCIFM